MTPRHRLERQVQQRAPAVHLGEPAAGELGVQIDDVVADRQGVGPGETEGQLVAGRERLVAPEPEPRVGDHRQPPRIEAEEQARLDGHPGGATKREVVAGRERHRHGGAEHPAEGGVAAAHDADLGDEPQITDAARGEERRGAGVPLVIEADRQGNASSSQIEEPDRREQVGAHAAVERHADLAPALPHDDRIVREVQEEAEAVAEVKRDDRPLDEHAAGRARGGGEALAFEPPRLCACGPGREGRDRERPRPRQAPAPPVGDVAWARHCIRDLFRPPGGRKRVRSKPDNVWVSESWTWSLAPVRRGRIHMYVDVVLDLT